MAKQLVEIAAQIYSCKVEELLSYREYENGSVVIIAPTGQKFTYSPEQIMGRILKNAEMVSEVGQASAGPVTKESPQATVSVAAPLEKGGEEMVGDGASPSDAQRRSEVGQAPVPLSSAAQVPVANEAGSVVTAAEIAAQVEAAAAPEVTAAPLKTESAPVVTVETPSASLISGPQGRGAAPDPGGADVTKKPAGKKKRAAKSQLTGSVSK